MSSGTELSSFALMLVVLLLTPIAIVSKELAFDSIIEGSHIKVPFYDPEVKQVSEARRKLENELVSGIHSLVLEASKLVLLENRNVALVGVKYGKKSINLLSDIKNKLKELPPGEFNPEIKRSFIKYMIEMYKDIFTKNNLDMDDKRRFKQMGEEEKVEAQKIIERMKYLQVRLDRMVLENPAGIYIAWKEIEFEGKSLNEQMAPIVKHFRHKSSIVVKIAESVIDLCGKFNWF